MGVNDVEVLVRDHQVDRPGLELQPRLARGPAVVQSQFEQTTAQSAPISMERRAAQFRSHVRGGITLKNPEDVFIRDVRTR